MRLRALWLVSVVAGCGLVQVNGKPVGGSSSSASPSSSTSQASNESAPASSSSQASNESHAAQPSSSSAPQAKPVEAAVATSAPEDAPGKTLDQIPKEGTKRQAWTPVQQVRFISEQAKDSYAAMIVADQLGDKLSHAARIGLIANCFRSAPKTVSSAGLWAACGPDVEEFDMNAYQKELQREGLSGKEQERLLGYAASYVSDAKEVGAAVMTAAKDDPGVAEIIAMGKAAREEWKTFASAHASELSMLADLEDRVAEDKNGLAGDCMAKTQPAMQKVLRATKWRENDTPDMPNYFYVNVVPNTVESHIAMFAWASCLRLVDNAAETLYAAAYNTSEQDGSRAAKRWLRRGPRTLAVAKVFGDGFKPKFASRSLDMSSMTKPKGGIWLGTMGMATPLVDSIAKLVKNGEKTTIKFVGKTYRCTDFSQTNKLVGWTTAGDPVYEQKCLSHGWADTPHSDVEMATEFTNGLAPGVELTVENGFPLVARKGEKFVAAFGIKL